MTEHEHQVIDARDLLPGDRIEDGGSTGLVVWTIKNTRYTTKIRDISGWEHNFEGPMIVRLPRQSGLELLR